MPHPLIYSHQGINDFVCGYKSYLIKEYIANYFLHVSDSHLRYAEPWKVTLVNTGKKTMTGGRLKRVANYLTDDHAFCLTYGDAVGDIDTTALIAFHRRQGMLATTNPPGRFGAIELRADHRVATFEEKPRVKGGRSMVASSCSRRK